MLLNKKKKFSLLKIYLKMAILYKTIKVIVIMLLKKKKKRMSLW